MRPMIAAFALALLAGCGRSEPAADAAGAVKPLAIDRLAASGGAPMVVRTTAIVSGGFLAPAQSAYGMTKAAIDCFTKTMAAELASFNILVNSVAPGFIDTRMTEGLSEEVKNEILSRIPLKRLGRPEEIAQMVRFLAVEGTYCTGNVFHVNGGMYGG